MFSISSKPPGALLAETYIIDSERLKIPHYVIFHDGLITSGSDFFSTHPSDANRIANMKKEMEEARKYIPR